MYCKTCKTCQLTGKPNQHIKPASCYPIPEKPFEYLLPDWVNLLPKSKPGSKYLFTVMCKSPHYPAAYPLCSIKTKPVLKALTSFSTTFGVPKVMQTDQGSNFLFSTFAQLIKHFKVKHQVSSAYHPEPQEALKRFHQTLKSMLRSYCAELDRIGKRACYGCCLSYGHKRAQVLVLKKFQLSSHHGGCFPIW